MERRLTAILTIDVVGYSGLMAKDEADTYVRLRAERNNFVEPTVATHNGHIIKLMGDGALIEFPSVVDAVSCAIAIQEGVAKRQIEVQADQRILFRIGVNVGDVIVEEGDIYGDGVNVAARLESLAHPGGICVSRAVFEYTRGKVDHPFEAMGEHQVKNIPDPIDVYRVAMQNTVGKPPPTPRPMFRWLKLGGGGITAMLAGLVLWFQPWQPTSSPLPLQEFQASADRPSLVVLPFDNLSADASDDYFADGLTDDLITDLSGLSGLLVIARNTAFSLTDQPVDIRDVGRKLGVRYVLDGSVRRAGDRIRINAQLIDSQTGDSLWADRIERNASDIFAVQDEVIRHIVETLSVRLSLSEQKRLERLPTQNLEAYDYYLRAEHAARTGFRPQLNEALALYKKSTELDPEFARAFAAIARTEAYVMRSNYDDVLAFPVARKRAYEHASKALKIDAELSLTYSVLAELQVIDGRYEDALISAERAVALGPNEAEAYAALNLVHTFSGRHADAVAAIETAQKLNPSLPNGTRLDASLAYMLNGQPERAVSILEQARDAAPNVDEIYTYLVAAYTLADRIELAHAAAAEAERLEANMSVELYRMKFGHLRRAEDLTTFLGALAKGGLQKWPWGFDAGTREPLTADEIRHVTFGSIWQGKVEGIGPGVTQIGADGSLAFRTNAYIATGEVTVSGEMLCERVESLSLGRTVCGPIYRNAASLVEGEYMYTYVNATKVFHFSPVD